MGPKHHDPGGGKRPTSYATSVRNNRRYEKLDRNVFHINIEKRNSDEFVTLNGDLVAALCDFVGIKAGEETEGYQVHYGGKGITVAIWAKIAISIKTAISIIMTIFSIRLIYLFIHSFHLGGHAPKRNK